MGSLDDDSGNAELSEDDVLRDGVVAAGTGRPVVGGPDAELTFAQLVVRHPLLGVGVLGFALAIGVTRGITAPPQVTMVLFGWGLCVWLGTSPPERQPAPHRLNVVGTLPWVAVALAFSGLELYNFSIEAGRTYEHPTLSVLTDPALDTFPVRFAAAIVWLAAGWHLARR